MYYLFTLHNCQYVSHKRLSSWRPTSVTGFSTNIYSYTYVFVHMIHFVHICGHKMSVDAIHLQNNKWLVYFRSLIHVALHVRRIFRKVAFMLILPTPAPRWCYINGHVCTCEWCTRTDTLTLTLTSARLCRLWACTMFNRNSRGPLLYWPPIPLCWSPAERSLGNRYPNSDILEGSLAGVSAPLPPKNAPWNPSSSLNCNSPPPPHYPHTFPPLFVKVGFIWLSQGVQPGFDT